MLDPSREVLQPPTAGKFPAWLTWLRDLHQRLTHGKDVADAHRPFVLPFDREVFTEGPEGELERGQLGPPIGVMGGRIGEHGLVRPAVIHEVGLTVPSQIGAPEPDRSFHRPLDDATGPEAVHRVGRSLDTHRRGAPNLDR